MNKHKFNKSSSGNKKAGRKVLYKGETYATQKELALKLGVAEYRVSRCLKYDLPLNREFIDYPLNK